MLNMSKELENLINEGHYHEIADRLHVIITNIDTHIIQHPVSKINKKIYSKVDSAVSLLCEAYQEAGQKL